MNEELFYWKLSIFQKETKDEVEALQKESEIPIEKILESLPKEIIEKPASIHSDSEEETSKVDLRHLSFLFIICTIIDCFTNSVLQ